MTLPDELELSYHLPPGHRAWMEADAVVAFAHTKYKCEDCDDVHLMTYPVTVNFPGGGYIEHLEPNEEIVSITQANPGGIMYSIYIDGPNLHHRQTIGYVYPGQSPHDITKKAIEFCDIIHRLYNIVKSVTGPGKTRSQIAEDLIEKLKDDDFKRFALRIFREFRHPDILEDEETGGEE